MPGVTISAGYGAGGSVIAPQVAQLLGVPLLDRTISSQVAEQLHVSVQDAEGGAVRRSLTDRFLAVLAPLSEGVRAAGTDAALPWWTTSPPGDGACRKSIAPARSTCIGFTVLISTIRPCTICKSTARRCRWTPAPP